MTFQRKPLTKQVGIKQIDVFTKDPFNGNPLLVVLYADNLSDQEKISVIKELNAKKGAFIFDADEGKSDFKLQVFDRQGEIDSDIHSCIGTTFIMLNEKQIKIQETTTNLVTIQTKKSICPLFIGVINGKIQKVLMMRTRELNPQFRMVEYDLEQIAEILNLTAKSICRDIILQLVKVDKWAMMIPLKHPRFLEELIIDEEKLLQMAKENSAEFICLFAIDERNQNEKQIVTRIFQLIENDAEERVIEDKITGQSNTNIAVFLFEQKLWAQEGSKMVMEFVQKTSEDRKGEVIVEMDVISDEIKEVRIGGIGVPIVEGKMTMLRY